MRPQSGNRRRPVAPVTFTVFLLVLALAFFSEVRGPAVGHLPVGAGLAGRVVMIDPGHGGRDPGTNRGEYREKDIVLEIGLVARDLLCSAGAVVIMTRDSDTDYSEPVPGRKKLTDLSARADLVAEVEPDVFLSIHVNSFPESRWRGPQVFYNDKFPCNHMLACALQDELAKACGLSREVKVDHRQYLLKQIEVPAACAEVGFISNPDDLAYMTSPQGQQRIAWALCRGLARFLEQAVSPAGGP